MAQAVKIIEGGKLVIPAAMRKAMGITRGDTVVVELLSNGELRVRPLASAIREAQEIVRRSVRRDRSLADELMRERKRTRFVSETYVLDASAVLCLLQEEKGAERVGRALPAPMIGAVNYSEVVGKLVETGIVEATVNGLIDMLQLKVIPFDRTAGSARRRPSHHQEARPLARRSRLVLRSLQQRARPP